MSSHLAKRFVGSARPTESGPQAAQPIDVIRVPGWSANPRLDWLVHGFSTRTGGLSDVYAPVPGRGLDLNLGLTAADRPEVVAANRMLFRAAVCGSDPSHLSLVMVQQIHSTIVERVDDRSNKSGVAREAPLTKADGLITAVPGLLLGIQTADCLPVLVADTRKRVVAAFHAGWRGTLARIVENGIGRMRMEFGSNPRDLLAALGPRIGRCCYSVGEEVRDQFESQFSYAGELFHEVSDADPVKEKYPVLFLTARAPGHSVLGPKLHLDIAAANRKQLLAAGLKASNIYTSEDCTACRTDRFFSHRQEHGRTGRMLSVIGMRKGRPESTKNP